MWTGFVAAALGGGCGDASSPVRDNRDIAVFLLLSRDADPTVGDSTLYAAVTDASARGRYVTPTRFVLSPALLPSVAFNWADRDLPGEFYSDNAEHRLSARGNLFLPWKTAGEARGREAITAGDYALLVEAGDRTVTGRAHVPLRPLISVTRLGGQVQRIDWQRIPGAAYFLHVDTDAPAFLVTTDTFYVVTRNQSAYLIPEHPRFELAVADTSLATYLSDSSRASVGLSGGVGIVAGLSQQWVALSAQSVANVLPSVAPRIISTLRSAAEGRLR